MADAYENYDGFVILHGTDTMSFAASALSFILKNLDKPVVITGSQLPLSNPRTDGVSNLVNSLLLAGSSSARLPVIPEVVLVFADVVLRGNRSRKMSTVRWRGFESPNCPPLGQIGEHIKIDSSLLRTMSETEPFHVCSYLNPDVIDIGVFPGMNERYLDTMLSMEGLRGVVLRTFGAGNAPTDAKFLAPIARAIGRDTTIVNVTQCPEGSVEAGRYQSGAGLFDCGVLNGQDMTPRRRSQS